MGYTSKFMSRARPRYKKFVKYTAKAIAKKALRKVNKINRNFEPKLFDVFFASAIDNVGDIIPLHEILQANTVDDRNGNQITANFMEIRWSMTTSTLASSLAVVCRLMLVRDKQQETDADPLVTAILQSAEPTAPLNRPLFKRFTVLRETLFTLNNVGDNGRAGVWKVKMNSNIRFNGPAVTDIQKNGLYFLALTDFAANEPTLTLFSRLHYTDN